MHKKKIPIAFLIVTLAILSAGATIRINTYGKFSRRDGISDEGTVHMGGIGYSLYIYSGIAQRAVYAGGGDRGTRYFGKFPGGFTNILREKIKHSQSYRYGLL